ncbi:hypothetical protein DH2020_046450 [Rehmannia glutinosa]|uniref:Phytocyanin domain-containing protein n=1 Tax=Rehmannia glutinosa TaxID=99300 RepID=A0ABR0UBA2_REHGL
MGNKAGDGLIFLILIIFSLFLLPGPVEGYKNYTVGDSLGWYDTLENPKVDYQKWAANKNFTLGDFLIFNTDNNHSVIQTYNFTTYKLCDYADALDNDTIEWSSGGSFVHHPALDLCLSATSESWDDIFFSSDYDGEQCQNGQHLKINVTYGQGLPPSLRSPSDDAPGPISPQSGDDESAPDTLVPSNFDNPKDTSDDGSESESSGSVSLSAFSKLFGVQLHGRLLIVLIFDIEGTSLVPRLQAESPIITIC